MSDTASATVVEIVGALTPKESSSLTGMGVGRSIAISRDRSMSKGQAERDVGDDMAMIGVVAGMCGSRFKSSGVLPLYEMKRSVSL
jgi:hypothetical protein